METLLKPKKIMTLLVMLLCVCSFSACGDDDDDGGDSGKISGTYSTPDEYDSVLKKNFRQFINISGSVFTYYSSYAVQDKSYWGNGASQVKGASGWYVESNAAKTASFVEHDGKLVLENGDIYVIQGNDLVKGGKRYSKYK